MKLYCTHTLAPLALLEKAVAETYALSPLPELARTAEGKPYFPGWPQLHFSLSHKENLVLCALSDRPVGADIETVVPRKPALVKYALTEGEYARYQEMGGDWPAFYALWTRREAWCKYTGLGLAKLWGQEMDADGLLFKTYSGENWRATVCGLETPPEDILWREAD